MKTNEKSGYLSILISSSALLISILGFLINWSIFKAESIPPEVFVILDKFRVSTSPSSISADFRVSIMNRSSKTIYLTNCSVVTEGVETGDGGYGEGVSACIYKSNLLSSLDNVIVEAGQTRIIPISYIQELKVEPESTLKEMGIDYSRIVEGEKMDPVKPVYTLAQITSQDLARLVI